MNEPTVSVVMGVFNGDASLEATLASVLGQDGVPFEFIVIDDGSTDRTPSILDAWAERDSRLVVVHQANTGLTRALAAGCRLARGEFIARQDCGDVSLVGRLQAQAALLRHRHEAVMVGSSARFVGPRGELLFDTVCAEDKLDEGLGATDITQLKGPPHHGATLFRRSAYEKAGGYRSTFVVAQDIDLWLRLREHGRCLADVQVRYEARMEAGSISARRRAEQFRCAELALACARIRRAGGSDARLLAAAQLPAARRKRTMRALEDSRFLYFVGACVARTDPAAARDYFWRSFRANPFFLKGLLRMALVRA